MTRLPPHPGEGWRALTVDDLTPRRPPEPRRAVVLDADDKKTRLAELVELPPPPEPERSWLDRLLGRPGHDPLGVFF